MVSSETSLLYLAYGSNLHPLRLSERLGPVECLGPVALPGWRLAFDKRGSDASAKANLRAAPGSDAVAWGAVYRLHRSQYSTLDRFEGVGRGYETFCMDLEIQGAETSVLTYLSPSHWHLPDGLPHDWYLELVRLGARYHRLPESVMDALAAQASRPDPDRERHALHQALIRRLRQAVR